MKNYPIIFTDGKHLISTNPDELHKFAKSIGLKREWFQNKPGKIPHYDIWGAPLKIVIHVSLGNRIELVSTRKLIKIWRAQ